MEALNRIYYVRVLQQLLIYRVFCKEQIYKAGEARPTKQVLLSDSLELSSNVRTVAKRVLFTDNNGYFIYDYAYLIDLNVQLLQKNLVLQNESYRRRHNAW